MSIQAHADEQIEIGASRLTNLKIQALAVVKIFYVMSSHVSGSDGLADSFGICLGVV